MQAKESRKDFCNQIILSGMAIAIWKRYMEENISALVESGVEFSLDGVSMERVYLKERSGGIEVEVDIVDDKDTKHSFSLDIPQGEWSWAD